MVTPQHIMQQMPQTTSAYRTLGDNYEEGILGAGIIYKQQSYCEILQHNYYSAVYIIDGAGWYEDDAVGKIRLGAGDVVQRFPHRTHKTYLSKGDTWAELFLAFGAQAFHALKTLGLISPRPVLRPGLCEPLLGAWYRMVRDMAEESADALPQLFTRQIDLVTAFHSLHRQNSPEGISPAICQAMEYISKNIEKGMTVTKAANFADLGYENFRKQFKTQTGFSPNDYIILQRVNRAKSLLANPLLTISEVAAALSYADAAAFSRQFKKVTGLTPGQFKKSV